MALAGRADGAEGDGRDGERQIGAQRSLPRFISPGVPQYTE